MIADVVQGLQVVVINCWLSMALSIAGCNCVVVKNLAHRRRSSCLRSCLWYDGSSSDVNCFCMLVEVLICWRMGCVVRIASCRLISIELSIQCCKGGCNTASSWR